MTNPTNAEATTPAPAARLAPEVDGFFKCELGHRLVRYFYGSTRASGHMLLCPRCDSDVVAKEFLRTA